MDEALGVSPVPAPNLWMREGAAGVPSETYRRVFLIPSFHSPGATYPRVVGSPAFHDKLSSLPREAEVGICYLQPICLG